jgi:dTDP-4-amino-4,6-dideoxygalactose transaminase
VIEGGWTINARRIPEAFSADTGAVLVSHLHGALLDMNWIAEICREANIPLVEDACQVPGATVCGKPAGTHGDAGVFSFGGSKLLTAGRGGAVVTDRDDVNQRMAIAADRGNDAFPLSALQAAALLPQLDMLNEFNARRLQNARRLRQSLQSSRLFQVLDEEWNEVNRPSFYKFPLLVRDGHERTAILAALQGEGIPADIGFLGFARRAPRRCQAIGDLCNSVRAARQLILLHHPLLLGDDRLIDQVLKGFAKIETGFSV